MRSVESLVNFETVSKLDHPATPEVLEYFPKGYAVEFLGFGTPPTWRDFIKSLFWVGELEIPYRLSQSRHFDASVVNDVLFAACTSKVLSEEGMSELKSLYKGLGDLTLADLQRARYTYGSLQLLRSYGQ